MVANFNILACTESVSENKKVYLLYLFWPFRGITKGHEYTVGQNSTHNDHAEKSKEPVKENMDNIDNHKHENPNQNL